VYPSEVQPLVDDLNSLLDDRGRMVQCAIAKAGDLPHGLKTAIGGAVTGCRTRPILRVFDVATSLGYRVERTQSHRLSPGPRPRRRIRQRTGYAWRDAGHSSI
jgi:hypothetical protein